MTTDESSSAHDCPEQTRPQKRQDLACEVLDGGAVIYDPLWGSVHRLNTVTLCVWDACNGLRTAREIGRGLVDEGMVEAGAARAAVANVLAELRRRKLLQDGRGASVQRSPGNAVPITDAAHGNSGSRQGQTAAAKRKAGHERPNQSARSALSRRQLLGGGMGTAVLAAPVISTFFATGAYASGPSASGAFGDDCKNVGYSCSVAGDCCDGGSVTDCEGSECCINVNNSGCTSDGDCCSNATGGCVAGDCVP